MMCFVIGDLPAKFCQNGIKPPVGSPPGIEGHGGLPRGYRWGDEIEGARSCYSNWRHQIHLETRIVRDHHGWMIMDHLHHRHFHRHIHHVTGPMNGSVFDTYGWPVAGISMAFSGWRLDRWLAHTHMHLLHGFSFMWRSELDTHWSWTRFGSLYCFVCFFNWRK